MNSYLFYDLETTGLNKSFDQIIQFAAIRTDLNLRELERHSIIVQLRSDVIPAPGAMITHRISVSDTLDGMCEYEAISRIHQLMNTPGTVSLGYNTLGFDDEFLRFSFYRNMLTPYTHQYSQGCSRMDLLPMTVLYYQHKNHVLNWPVIDEKPTLKLEHLSRANGLAKGQAHDAMVDVEATLALARRFFQEKEMWNFLLGYFNKDTDRERVSKIAVRFQTETGPHRLAVAGSSRYGHANNYQASLLSMGSSIHYKNQELWLRLDLPELRETTLENVAEKTWAVRKRFGEPVIVLPPSERFTSVSSEESRRIVAENLAWIDQNQDLFAEIVRHHREYKYPDVPDVDLDASLYIQGFMSRKEQELCQDFHRASLHEKIGIVDLFKGSNTGILAARLLNRNYPEVVTETIYQEYGTYLKRVNPESIEHALSDFRGEKKLTPRAAMEEIAVMEADEDRVLDDRQREILDELKDYLMSEFAY